MKKTVLLGLSLATTVLMASDDFGQRREMESHSHQERINNLQNADRCINSAQTKEAYQKCEMEEKQNREAMRTESFSQRKSMMLQKIDERMQKGAAMKSCISAANSQEELKKCMPERREGMNNRSENFKQTEGPRN